MVLSVFRPLDFTLKKEVKVEEEDVSMDVYVRTEIEMSNYPGILTLLRLPSPG